MAEDIHNTCLDTKQLRIRMYGRATNGQSADRIVPVTHSELSVLNVRGVLRSVDRSLEAAGSCQPPRQPTVLSSLSRNLQQHATATAATCRMQCNSKGVQQQQYADLPRCERYNPPPYYIHPTPHHATSPRYPNCPSTAYHVTINTDERRHDRAHSTHSQLHLTVIHSTATLTRSPTLTPRSIYRPSGVWRSARHGLADSL